MTQQFYRFSSRKIDPGQLDHETGGKPILDFKNKKKRKEKKRKDEQRTAAHVLCALHFSTRLVIAR